MQLLSQNDVEASTSLRIKLTKLQAEKAAKDMVATKDDASIQRFLSIVVPFIKDDCEGFSYLNPTMNCIVLEGLNACFDTSSWGELALVPVVKQEPVDTDRCTDDDVDWEAGRGHVVYLGIRASVFQCSHWASCDYMKEPSR